MPGMRETALAHSSIISRTAVLGLFAILCVACRQSTSPQPPVSTVQPAATKAISGDTRMVSIQQAAQALMHKDVTVAALAPALGTVTEKGTDDYRVKPDTPGIIEISVGIPDGKDATAAPSYLQYYFAVSHPTYLTAILPDCKDWKQIPGNPGASPYLYSCRFAGSTAHLEVNFVATLTDDVKTPAAAIQQLVLQRNVW